MAVGDGFRANQIAPKFGAQMWRIQPTKNSVPVGVVALCPQQQVSRILQFFGGLGAGSTFRSGRETPSDMQHFFVQQIGLRIFAEKTAPRAATEKREDIGARVEFLQ